MPAYVFPASAAELPADLTPVVERLDFSIHDWRTLLEAMAFVPLPDDRTWEDAAEGQTSWLPETPEAALETLGDAPVVARITALPDSIAAVLRRIIELFWSEAPCCDSVEDRLARLGVSPTP